VGGVEGAGAAAGEMDAAVFWGDDGGGRGRGGGMKRMVVVALSGWLMGMTFTPTGLTGDVTYEEPTTNADGSPLTDLDRTEIVVDNRVDAPGPVIVVPASAPTGGGAVTQTVSIPTPSVPSQVLAEIRVRACDNAKARNANEQDNCSSEAVVTHEIDTLSPSGVQ